MFTPIDPARFDALCARLPEDCASQARAVKENFRWRQLLVHEGPLVGGTLVLTDEHKNCAIVVDGPLDLTTIELTPRGNVLFIALGPVRCDLLRSTVHVVIAGSVQSRCTVVQLDTGSFTVGGDLSAEILVEDEQVLNVLGTVTGTSLSRDDDEQLVVDGQALSPGFATYLASVTDMTLAWAVCEFARTRQPLLAAAASPAR